ncbi:MAG: hypothetical protein LC623_01105 [Halobacteriales archaeon]|nr:hypothetical protein [Halobacteriales archaeon]
MTSKESNKKILGLAGITLALLALTTAPAASAAAVVIPNGTGCFANDSFAPAGYGELNCVIAASGRCTLTIIVTDGNLTGNVTNYIYQKTLNLGQPTWIVLVSVPAGFTAGASCPPLA